MPDIKILFRMAILLSVVLVITGCSFQIIKPPSPIGVAFRSHHGRYVTAMGDGDDWAIRQEPKVGDCAWFTQHHLTNGKITLETCYGKYVVAPETGFERQDWMLRQESRPGKCGQFDLYDLGGNRVAFKTCAGRFFTAGDGNWLPGLEWSVVGETDYMDSWEIFTVLEPHTSSIANFDSCTDEESLIRPIQDPSVGNTLVVSYVREAGRGCIARLEYDIVEWSALLIQLQGADLSTYTQLVFDVKAIAHKVPTQLRIELKRAGGQEVSILNVSGITTDWQTMSLDLSDFGVTDYTDPLSSFTDMEGLLFVLDANESEKTAVIYLDNIDVRRGEGNP